jgi:hypothetical protein
MAQETTTVKAIKAGDWVLPIEVNGEIVHALQINKSKEEKENITTILAEYTNVGVTVYEYAGKNNNPVLLVKATEKLKSQRSSVTRNAIIETLMQDLGVNKTQAEALHAKMQANVLAKKVSKDK